VDSEEAGPAEVPYRARLPTAHFARLRLGLRCMLKTKKRVPRAPRPNARLTNAQIAGVRGIANGAPPQPNERETGDFPMRSPESSDIR
jgi:hypothetical protein